MSRSIMKQTMKIPALLLAATLALGACGGSGGSDTRAGTTESPLMVAVDGTSTINIAALGRGLNVLPIQTLSTAEQDSLTYMREEEKLAHDVYVYLNALWGASLPIFNNIAASEASHTEAIRTLLVRYSVPDPAATTAAGQFTNAALQTLYSGMVASGSASLIEALRVGAAIEEVDIIDIQAALVHVDNRDIRLVYENLLKGSRNHLRAFVLALQQLGVVYSPQYLSPADYQTVVGIAFESA
jgi:hypothetical protein